jgi:hypothetical protein
MFLIKIFYVQILFYLNTYFLIHPFFYSYFSDITIICFPSPNKHPRELKFL